MTPSTTKIAYVFPGQGSQFTGMGQDFYEQTEPGKSLFQLADEILGFPLSRLCFEGPENELKKTSITQPAIYVCSVISYELLKARGLQPTLVMGHSLGEYSALYAAGVFDFTTGLKLVRKRGELTQSAGESYPGSMSAFIGLDPSTVEQICLSASQSTGKTVCLANFNSPRQLVISGDDEAVKSAMALASQQGAKRVVPLKVSAAFHSPLMNSAAMEFKEFLNTAHFNDPSIDFINNADARVLANADEIRDSLVRQIYSCVRWTESVQNAIAMGYRSFIEVGPGKVLSGLIRQIDSSVSTYPAGTLVQIDKTSSTLSCTE
ncbi:ACP S-malonyltransferase [Candidatus Sumerlaeota bacterium]|nr:ACP S-malonyltransferase [Candidatus Sumerlaeota bacterium]